MARRAAQQLLVVRRFVLLVEAGRETKIGELKVAVFVEEDVVGFDVAVIISLIPRSSQSRWEQLFPDWITTPGDESHRISPTDG